MKKALIVATIGGFIAGFELNDIKILQNMGYEVHGAADFRAVSSEDKKRALETSGLIQHQVSFSRSPFTPQTFKAYKELKRLMIKENFDLMHCHTPLGGVLGRIAAHKTRVPKVIYTAHGFHFFEGAPIHNWMIYYPIEKIFSLWTDVLITINQEDYRRAKNKFHMKRLEYVPGVGIDLEKYSTELFSIIERSKVRDEIGIPEQDLWLLSVGELNENKNHETVIRALAKLRDKRKDAIDIYYTIAGEGSKKNQLQSLIDDMGLSGRVKLLGYRNDISLLCEAADIFVMPSFREGLSVALMEAMASGMPCVASKIRGNTDLVDENGGALFNPYSVDECMRGIEQILSRNIEAMGVYNRNKIKHFGKTVVKEAMTNTYENANNYWGGAAYQGNPENLCNARGTGRSRR